VLAARAVLASASVNKLTVTVVAHLDCGYKFSVGHSVMGFDVVSALSSSPFLIVILESF
jgi:hypothetical protein